MKTQTPPMGLQEMIEDAAGIGACFKSPIPQQKGYVCGVAAFGLLSPNRAHTQTSHCNRGPRAPNYCQLISTCSRQP